MRHIRSADPWSSFLDPAERAEGGGSPHHFIGGAGSHDGSPHGGEADLPATGRRVIDALRAARGALTVDQLQDRVGLTLLEVADVVRELSGRGLVALRRESGEEVVQLTAK